jgi:hypothetical protein
MFDKLIEDCESLKSAFIQRDEAKKALAEAEANVKLKKESVKQFTNDFTFPYHDLGRSAAQDHFQEVLYRFNEDVYLISFHNTERCLVAEKIEFYKPQH